jgi:hypothetical protein
MADLCPSMEDTMADPIVFPGTVKWSGENPGISLKETFIFHAAVGNP